jgi:hypothetical protein
MRLQHTTQSPALIMMTPQGQIIARVGSGTDEEAANLGAVVARLARKRPFSATGPVGWYVLDAAVLVICDKRGLDRVLSAKAIELVEELSRLMRSPERVLQTTHAPWCMI